MEIRQVKPEEIESVLQLVWNVFEEFEGPIYSEEGIQSFYRSIHDPLFIKLLTFYGAFEGDTPLGVIATRSKGSHIALLFVDGDYHKQGIARKLMKVAWILNQDKKMTVNASPYAVEVYKRFGFEALGEEQTISGIRFTPMECDEYR